MEVRNEELRSTREVAREISACLDALKAGDVEKIVITKNSKMVGVLITPERYDQMNPPAPKFDPLDERLGIVCVPNDRGIPVGTVQKISILEQAVAPYLLPDGSEYNPDHYPELHAVLGDTYGKNKLPDLRGRAKGN